MAKPVAADGRRNSKTLRFEVAERDVDVPSTDEGLATVERVDLQRLTRFAQ